MAEFIQIQPQELSGNVFTKIGQDWMLIGAEKDGRVNMMTASWGGLGVYWHKPVAYTVIRPHRFTKAFVDNAEGFSLTFFPEQYREQLNFCGKNSGRDYDKVKECAFDVLYDEGIPYFAQAELVMLCRHLVAQPLAESAFLHPQLIPDAYPKKDYHTLYISEIVKVLLKNREVI
jgi:flavin reductase (DIM6/NTAB) family NADH-FMN oxidoreductase RutF